MHRVSLSERVSGTVIFCIIRSAVICGSESTGCQPRGFCQKSEADGSVDKKQMISRGGIRTAGLAVVRDISKQWLFITVRVVPMFTEITTLNERIT